MEEIQGEGEIVERKRVEPDAPSHFSPLFTLF